jgi:hypothetical protein
MRPIDADKAKETFIQVLEEIKKRPRMSRDEIHIIAACDTICEILDDEPTVDRVVRCKECFFSKVDDKREPKYKCMNICRDGCTQLVGSDDYCSYGLLKSDMDKNTEE